MKDQGRTDPRTPYAEEYRNRRGFSETIQDHATRIKNVELRANQAPLLGEQAIEVRLNGIPVGSENILDFIEGANVTLTVSDDGQVIHIEIAASGASPTGYQTIEDEGTPLPQETVLDFQGAGVTATAGAGKTIVTIPGGSSSGGGVVAYDAVSDLNYLGVDGDPTTLATDSIVYRFSTIQAAITAWELGGMPTVSSPMVLLINKGDYSLGNVVMSTAGAVVLIATPGHLQIGTPDNLQAPVVVVGDIKIVNQSEMYRLEGIMSGDVTLDPSLDTTGMFLEARRCYLHGIVGGLSNSLFEDSDLPVGWNLDVGQGSSENLMTIFRRTRLGGSLSSLDDVDHEMKGIYAFLQKSVVFGINGNLGGLVVATDKHFVFDDSECMAGDLFFTMDGGTLTLDLLNFRLTPFPDGVPSGFIPRIRITDAGGGGTVILNWIGGSAPPCTAGSGAGLPVLEVDSTIVVTGIIDGVNLGTPNSPAFKGQFVDFTFGDAISPPSYVVEFL